MVSQSNSKNTAWQVSELSTVYRFKSQGYINIARTVYETAKKIGYDEVCAADVELELIAQGIDVVRGHIGTGANKTQISLTQIKTALSNHFEHVGKGWYRFV